MSNATMRVGFIGLGIMGRPMAMNILKAGFPLTVFNRTASKAADLVAAGAAQAASPREVAAQSDVVITMVTDTPDVEGMLTGPDGVLAAARPGLIFIDMSTISPAATREMACAAAGLGVTYLDAPVTGGDIGAQQATLSIMVGGDAAALERVRPILASMGKRITHVGPSGAGQTVKACNQILCAVNMMATCEALSLAAASGVDLAAALSVLTGGAGSSWALEKLGPRIARRDLAPGFMVKLIAKDLNIVMAMANKARLPLPGTALAAQHFLAVQADGGDELGTQAMITAYEKLAARRVGDG